MEGKFKNLSIVGGSFIIVFFFSLGVIAWSGMEGVTQPIRFNHRHHKDQGIGCETCHQYVQEQAFAGLPTKDTCMMCHASPVTKSKEEEKIREYAKKGETIPWKRIFWDPPHVFFSHRRHVAMGQIECKTCHGAMEDATSPPRHPIKVLKMNDCIGCHIQRKVSTDCLTCHK